MAKKIIQHHFGKPGKDLEYKPAGKTNFVFEITISKKEYIIRIANSERSLHNFLKEQWVVQTVGQIGVPVSEILEVGNEIVPLPYMLQEKVAGTEAVDHPNRGEILFELGKYAKLIHSVPTNGFGNNFDWSRNKLSKNHTWSDFLQNELEVNDRLRFLEKQGLLAKLKVKKLASQFKKIERWKVAPTLNHCDLRLKNVIVNEQGKILAIIDWENCSSNIAPYWDFSIALHDLSIDNKQKFLEGYGLDYEAFERNAFALTAFNLINYVPTLQRLESRKNKKQLDFYKLRMNGLLDLFSL